jgi:hypothetical protein
MLTVQHFVWVNQIFKYDILLSWCQTESAKPLLHLKQT